MTRRQNWGGARLHHLTDKVREHEMNIHFSDAVTSTAFLLHLSMRQCNTVLRLRVHESKFGKPPSGRLMPSSQEDSGPASADIVGVDSIKGLAVRGLVFWHQDESGKTINFGGLTRAGELCADLLTEAGLTIESTNTKSVLRRMAA